MPAEPPRPRAAGAARRKLPRPFGRYILERTLSRGGMGQVFLAVVKGLEQRCVIKTIRGDLTGEEEFIGRFADEAKILVRAAHQNIIRYFDAGRVASDYYIAMEYVHGRDLGDVLDRAYERGEPMPTDIGLYITVNLLEGLHYAHELTDERGRRMGLVHRDISPQNVLIGFDGSVKLIDFGLARTDLLPNRTHGALAVGKYGYMSPEQARHEPLDGRADVYSAGVMLFEVFTGDRLVDEQDQATLWQRVLAPKHRRPRTVLPSLSREVDDLVMKAVAVDPAERFATARAMADAARALRGPRSSRAALQDYLRYLYPRVDFYPPPLPPLDDLAEGVEQSIIIATSREGARSVFGRGELPIEGTMQIDARDIRAEIERRRRLSEARSRGGASPQGRAAPRSADPGRSRRGLAGRAGIGTSAEQPTLIAPMPTRGSPSGDAPRPGAAPPDDRGAILAPSALAASFVDDEQTVMMAAPPASQLAGPDPVTEPPTVDTRRRDPNESDASALAGPPSVPSFLVEDTIPQGQMPDLRTRALPEPKPDPEVGANPERDHRWASFARRGPWIGAGVALLVVLVIGIGLVLLRP